MKKLFFCIVVTIMYCSCVSTQQIDEPLDIEMKTSSAAPVSQKPNVDKPMKVRPVEIRKSPI